MKPGSQLGNQEQLLGQGTMLFIRTGPRAVMAVGDEGVKDREGVMGAEGSTE